MDEDRETLAAGEGVATKAADRTTPFSSPRTKERAFVSSRDGAPLLKS
jgi:hypothetical protein